MVEIELVKAVAAILTVVITWNTQGFVLGDAFQERKCLSMYIYFFFCTKLF